jgi:hypothetical protein
MREKILPKHENVASAVEEMRKKLKRPSLAERNFRERFRNAFGVSATMFLKIERQEIDPVTPEGQIEIMSRRIHDLEVALAKATEEGDVARAVKAVLSANIDEVKKPTTFALDFSERKRLKHGTPTIVYSDIHHGEVVHHAEVGGVNHFNMAISRNRVKRVTERVVHMVDNVLTPSTYHQIVVGLGGDMVTGNIHDELRRTNQEPIFPVILDLVDIFQGVIKSLKKRFGKVFVPCVVGNHGRLDKKPTCKKGVQDNFDWLFYKMLEFSFSDDKNVIFQVSESFLNRYVIHDTRYMQTHGDQFRFGQGISGIATPLALGSHKLRKQLATIEGWTGIDSEYDILVVHHFHQLMWLRDIVVNGSIKGMDEYAMKKQFPYEPPQQAMWFTTDRGLTLPMALFAEDKPGLSPQQYELPGIE